MNIQDQLIEYSKEIQKTKKKIIDLIFYDKWTSIPINRRLLENFCLSGLYVLYSDNEILYIGISSNIGVRILKHIERYGNDLTKIKIKKYKDWELATIREKELIQKLKPKNNKYIVSKNIIRINKENWKAKQATNKELK